VIAPPSPPAVAAASASAPAPHRLGAWLVALACVLQFALFAWAVAVDWGHLRDAGGAATLGPWRVAGAFLPAALLLAAGVCFLFARARGASIALFAMYLAWGLWWLGTIMPGPQDAIRLAIAAVGIGYGLVLARGARRPDTPPPRAPSFRA